ncbi:MAG: sugar transferase [Planctomycetota bacterium]
MEAKRIFDLLVAGSGLIATAPVLGAIAVLIKKEDGGPVFYRGERVGRYGEPFKIFKFRTMVVDAEKSGVSSTTDADDRITRAGKMLRKFKLDELAQLINVVKGDMSLVGPRPEVQRFVELYTQEERAILDVRPGITDWASIWNNDEGAVIARSGIKDADEAYARIIRPTKIDLQLRYVRTRSMLTDLKLLLRTVRAVLERHHYVADIAPPPGDDRKEPGISK